MKFDLKVVAICKKHNLFQDVNVMIQSYWKLAKHFIDSSSFNVLDMNLKN